ncbi:MAG: hypothetical protein ABIC91_00685 [Nanoarchaeota archaeon]|nr:hypothetical protein [Nanoarchaeota archaeon]MBU1029887.1 hypothetical protein [Nanoarchaeota archaeon]MBU1850681.1 hypothetical protein [Nanoarchaeota archaeon]
MNTIQKVTNWIKQYIPISNKRFTQAIDEIRSKYTSQAADLEKVQEDFNLKFNNTNQTIDGLTKNVDGLTKNVDEVKEEQGKIQVNYKTLDSNLQEFKTIVDEVQKGKYVSKIKKVKKPEILEEAIKLLDKKYDGTSDIAVIAKEKYPSGKEVIVYEVMGQIRKLSAEEVYAQVKETKAYRKAEAKTVKPSTKTANSYELLMEPVNEVIGYFKRQKLAKLITQYENQQGDKDANKKLVENIDLPDKKSEEDIKYTYKGLEKTISQETIESIKEQNARELEAANTEKLNKMVECSADALKAVYKGMVKVKNKIRDSNFFLFDSNFYDYLTDNPLEFFSNMSAYRSNKTNYQVFINAGRKK